VLISASAFSSFPTAPFPSARLRAALDDQQWPSRVVLSVFFVFFFAPFFRPTDPLFSNPPLWLRSKGGTFLTVTEMPPFLPPLNDFWFSPRRGSQALVNNGRAAFPQLPSQPLRGEFFFTKQAPDASLR